MSNEAAAFFAKKKKKKGFKFNANNVDVSQITSTTHVDAPQVSSETVNSTAGINTGGDWDEKGLSTRLQSSTLATGEILDMKTTYESQMNEKEEIQEKLRVEETRKQLAAAREGMKKEEERLKEEMEAKKKKDQELAEARNMTADGSARWVPSHMRSSAPSSGIGGIRPMGLGRSGVGSSLTGFQRQVNTSDEELFPDLATADKMMKQEEEQKVNAAKAKKKAVETKQVEKEEIKEEKEIEKETPVAIPVPLPVIAPVTTAASIAAELQKKPKKKKKDLSTFKA